MGRKQSIAHLLPELIRTLFSKRITLTYPFEPLQLPSCYRGKIVIDETQCKGCGLCVRDCPAFALELERESGDAFRMIHHYDRCAYCGQCAETCRSGAISLVNEFVRACAERETLTETLVERGKGEDDREADTECPSETE